MTHNELLALFLEKIPGEYPKHMFYFFAGNAACGVVRPFASDLLRAIGLVESASVGYANE